MTDHEYNKKYYRENRERERARSKTWYDENKDSIDREAKRAYSRKYYQEHKGMWNKKTPEQRAKYNANRRAKYATDPECKQQAKAKAREWQNANPEKRKAQRLREFGISLEEFNQIMQKQGSCCAICGYSDQSNKKFFPMVDHDHVSGKVRGLLCSNCNQAIGKFKDDITIIESAISYLRRNGNG